MSGARFDTEGSVKTLTAAGMPEAQALAVVAVFGRAHEMEATARATKSDIADTRADLLQDIVDARADLAQTKETITQGLVETKTEILKWVIGTVGIATAINVATVIATTLALAKILSR